MKMIGTNVLVTETEVEKTTAGGIILSTDVKKGSKPALVLAYSAEAEGILNKGDRVFLAWDKSMPVDVDGNMAAIIDLEHIKAVL